jgi:CHAT domain-containing protein
MVFVGDLPALSDPSSRLILEPDPILGNLPWSCVEVATGAIGLQFNLEEAPSILLDDDSMGNVATRRSTTGKPLIVGASIGAGATQLLPEALDEARIVAETDPRANLLLGHQATESEVTEYLTTAPVIHFAGHAAMQDGTMRLLLAPANTPGDKPYIDAAWFRAHPPRAAQIAVFSACSTGKGQDGWNHGMGDIVETLASLGVQQVVATRWQIDSASAVPIMDAFYHGLANGMSVPQALTAARQSLFRDARHRHPYYWAAYYASGVGTTDLREVFHGANE